MFLFLMVLLTLAVFQIFQRNVAGAAPMWVDIMLRHLTFAIGLLGASLAVHAQKQIQALGGRYRADRGLCDIGRHRSSATNDGTGIPPTLVPRSDQRRQYSGDPLSPSGS